MNNKTKDIGVSFRVKPQMIQTSTSTQMTPKITIMVRGGIVEDIVKEKCNEVEVVVHDYDIEVEGSIDERVDGHGYPFRVITF